MATERVLHTTGATKGGEVAIVWVDATIKSDDSSSKHTIESLKKIHPNLITFTNIEEFSKYIGDVRFGRLFLISSGGLGKDVTRIAGGNDSVEAIYVFCGNPALHESWASKCTKIKGVQNRIQPICDSLKTFIGGSSGAASSSSSSSSTSVKPAPMAQLGSSFLTIAFFKHVIMKMRHDPQASKHLADVCQKLFKANADELELVEEFRKDYRADKAAWWFTRESFVYRMVNTALRQLEVDIIMNMAFFIKDLEQQIQQLYKAQLSSYQGKTLKLYRGQGLSNAELRHIMKHNGEAMAFNSFLSTSKKKDICYTFASQASKRTDVVGVLFTMTVDTKISATPFADLKDHEYMSGEESIVFGMNSVFRIGAVKNDENNNRIFEIELTLIPVDAEELNVQIQRLDRKLADDANWKVLADHFLEQDKFELVETMCSTILQQPIPDRDKPYYYNCLGMIHEKKKDYSEALKLYEDALKIEEQILSPKDAQLAVSRYNIGMLYYDLKDTDKALRFFNKALETWQKTHLASHPQILVVTRMIRKIEAAHK